MNSMFSNLLKACVEIWKNVGVTQKASIVIIVIIAIAAVVGVVYIGSQPDFQVLYANLDSSTAARVYELAKDENIPVKLKNSGKTILVPSKNIYSLRLQAIKSGIKVTETNGGWGLFDKMDMAATQKQQQVTLMRAIQGELEKMIQEMPGVAGAKVMLALPEQKVFVRGRERRPTASVMIIMDGGRTLSKGQINSIRYLVSSSIGENMQPNDVTITDNRGRLLAKQTLDDDLDGTGDTDSKIETTIKTENLLKEKAEAILRPIVGENSVIAMVSCELNFNNIDEVIETYQGDQAVPLSERTVSTDSSKQDEKSGGAAGAAANITVDVAQPDGQKGESNVSTQASKTTETQYAIPKVIRKITTRGARLKRINVAVTIAYKKDKDGKAVKWSNQEMSKFTNLVKTAVGIPQSPDTASGANMYAVTVEQSVFAIPVKKEVAMASISLLDKVTYGVEGFTNSPVIRPLLGIALLILLFKVFKSYFKKSKVEGTEIGFSGMGATPGSQYTDGAEEEPLLDEYGDPRSDTNPIEFIKKKSESEPTVIATAMESWLGEKK